ncbi:nodulin-related protein 1-like [Amaranthus tricolor]|uniref:nodulin-related protein 1-like n=1 Tax=Amaranthus tricolor TaxID=29722 RepID=UPI002588E372|nr:nodulin-related protein 1-like [Amaranthus tricolor]
MEEEYIKGKTTKPNPPNKSDLLSSAKLMADAAKSALAHDTEKIDKAKVAGAAADLIGAAKHYGKLEEKNFGKYVGKAETYLHQYHSSHSSSATTGSQSHGASHGGSYEGGEGKHGQHSSSGGSGGGSAYGDYVKLAQGFLNKKQDHGGENGGGHSSGGGAGDYIKLAQGLLNKKQNHGGEGGSGGAGDYIKLAQGFMKKH